jgi:hypothetical protein
MQFQTLDKKKDDIKNLLQKGFQEVKGWVKTKEDQVMHDER